MALIQFKATVSLLILALIISSATSARILDEDAAATAPAVVPATTTTPGVTAATTPGGATATATTPGGAAATVPLNPGPDDHSLTFFMHDILGGSRPSALAVTGIVANPALGGQVPFAKPNGAVLPVNNGIPTDNANGGIVSNNNIPFLTGLSGFTSNFGQDNNGNNNNIIGGVPGFPVLDSAQFPSCTTLQKLMFGTMTVFDDELTEGHQLGSGLVGKAQGFYVYSSEDGTSQTMVFTVMFRSGGYADSLSFFGVHRTAVAESHLAIMGGTGKYVNAKGFAIVKTFPGVNQHETDGVETLLQITVYLAY
ncbi:hypothetical protein CDL12_08877 [Handroanthus impetiginosus]|uniref:Dirigent protein n=1 Tax=Handroanthus impetiginosus TaxID=429701 RepID=A0A2G9HLS1_9LAMI|nr:hypothetical protein CDL12_08877 [Handroanthus impetiginosus]